MALLLQFDVEQEKASHLVVIVEDDNLQRMNDGDPITFETGAGFLKPVKYGNNFNVMIAYAKDPAPIYELAKAGDTMGIIRYITRNWKFERTRGDGLKFQRIGSGGQG